MCRQVIVNDQDILALLHPELGDSAASEGREMLQARQAARLGDHHTDTDFFFAYRPLGKVSVSGQPLTSGLADTRSTRKGLWKITSYVSMAGIRVTPTG